MISNAKNPKEYYLEKEHTNVFILMKLVKHLVENHKQLLSEIFDGINNGNIENDRFGRNGKNLIEIQKYKTAISQKLDVFLQNASNKLMLMSFVLKNTEICNCQAQILTEIKKKNSF